MTNFNIANHYWTVTDTNPGTHVFSSASNSYVVLADSTYVAWLAAGGEKFTIATAAALWAGFDAWARSSWRGGFQFVTLNLAVSPVTITTALEYNYVNVSASDTGLILRLPEMRRANSVPLGQQIIVFSQRGNQIPFIIKNFDGSATIVAEVYSGDFISLAPDTNDSAVGTWTVDFSRGMASGADFGIIYGKNEGTQGRQSFVPTAAGTNGQLLVGQTSAAPLYKTVSGDFTLASSGAATIKTDVALAGAPTTTTAAAGTDTTAIATTAFVNASIRRSIQPAQITSNQNNFAPTGIATASKLVVTSDAARSITGIDSTGWANGQDLTVFNAGSFTITLKALDAGSSSANQFGMVADIVLTTFTGCRLFYYAGFWRPSS